MDIEKVKKDTVYFVENVLDLELQDWQKDLLRRHQNGEKLYVSSGYNYSKKIVIDSIRDWYNFKR